MRSWFDFWFRRCIYCLLVYIICFPTYRFSLFFPYLSPSLLIFSFENRLSPFPGCMSLKATKAGFISFVYFVLEYICFGWWMCAFVVLGLVFFAAYQAKRLAGETSPKWPILCRVGRKTTSQSLMWEWRMFCDNSCAAVASLPQRVWRLVVLGASPALSLQLGPVRPASARLRASDCSVVCCSTQPVALWRRRRRSRLRLLASRRPQVSKTSRKIVGPGKVLEFAEVRTHTHV